MVNENNIQCKSQLNNNISESMKTRNEVAVAQDDIVTKNVEESVHDVCTDQLFTNSALKDSIRNGKNEDVNEKISSYSDANELGDYTNIRATIGSLGVKEGGFMNKKSMDDTRDQCNVGVSTNATSNNNVQQKQQQQQQPTQHVQSSAFSFKHFLSNSNVLTAPSSTVTSLDAVNVNVINSTANFITVTTTKPLQTSTGARPKVPQSTSSASSSISSLIGSNLSVNSNSIGKTNVTTITSSSFSKMKRSPRFSSFDSQASLAEYVDTTTLHNNSHHTSAGTSSSTEYPLYLNKQKPDDHESWNLPSTSSAANNISKGDQAEYHQYVHRSYSNYDMTRPQTSSCRRHVPIGQGDIREVRPSGLSLNMSCNTSTNTNVTTNNVGDADGNAKVKLDLPLYKCSSTARNSASTNRMRNLSTPRTADYQCRTNIINSNNRLSTDFQATTQPPPLGTASALPDFVQDHWMDSWYSYDMQLNSPNTSPVDEFFDDSKGECGTNDIMTDSDINVNRTGPCINLENHAEFADIASSIGSVTVNHNANLFETNPMNSSSMGGSKMLPDFLSDGPIIHSSQRLADIATGLPPNTVGSPQDSTLTIQLTRMRQENERLQRDLTEMRMALCEQTRRANDLERQLFECQKIHYELAANETEKENLTITNKCKKNGTLKEGDDDDRKERKKHSTFTGCNQEMKLKQQIHKLTTELETLHLDKEREGAVGGVSISNCHYSKRKATLVGATAAGAASNDEAAAVKTAPSKKLSRNIHKNELVTTDAIRSSRPQQLAKQLLAAAANAEGNLRQLLVGVDNLRQMAADIENSSTHYECLDASPDLFSNFLDECNGNGDGNIDDNNDNYHKSNPDKFKM